LGLATGIEMKPVFFENAFISAGHIQNAHLSLQHKLARHDLSGYPEG